MSRVGGNPDDDSYVSTSHPTATPVPTGRRGGRTLTALWGCAALVLIGLAGDPVSTGPVRAAQVAAVVTLIGAPLWWTRRSNWTQVLCVAIGAVVLTIGFWPAADAAGADRTTYVRTLKRYEGTPYVWGGEASTGIDCSGLARRAMVETLLQRAWDRNDPSAVRDAIDLWWHDRSAEALGAGHRGDTVPVGTAASLHALDHAEVQPGDLAVSRNGKHVLVYVGSREWIAADPPAVARWTAGETSNRWFDVPMRFVRWRWFAL